MEGASQSRAERLGEVLGALLAVPVVLILFGLSAYAIGDAIFTDTPAPEDPGFIDRVLASHAVVAAVRIALIFAAAYIVISVVALIARRQWLTRVGPVEVSEQVTGVVAENTMLRNMLEGASETIDDLRDELQETTEVLVALVDTIDDPEEGDEDDL